MSVVNVKVQYLRPKYKNLKEWCEDPNNIYIGRKGVVFIDNKRYPEHDSPFFNPFKIGRDGDRNEVVNKYYQYITVKIKNNEVDLGILKNKNLGCWCAPELCHGHVLMYLLNHNKC